MLDEYVFYVNVATSAHGVLHGLVMSNGGVCKNRFARSLLSVHYYCVPRSMDFYGRERESEGSHSKNDASLHLPVYYKLSISI